jgi:hypothetical protein
MPAHTATVKIYQTQDEVNQDLNAGRLDYVVLDSIVADNFLKTDVGRTCCELKGTVPSNGEGSSPGVGAGCARTILNSRQNLTRRLDQCSPRESVTLLLRSTLVLIFAANSHLAGRVAACLCQGSQDAVTAFLADFHPRARNAANRAALWRGPSAVAGLSVLPPARWHTLSLPIQCTEPCLI